VRPGAGSVVSIDAAHASIARLQRGRNGQPVGNFASDGAIPGIWASFDPRWPPPGSEAMSPAV
jgi:hypothetical protein